MELYIITRRPTWGYKGRPFAKSGHFWECDGMCLSLVNWYWDDRPRQRNVHQVFIKSQTRVVDMEKNLEKNGSKFDQHGTFTL